MATYAKGGLTTADYRADHVWKEPAHEASRHILSTLGDMTKKVIADDKTIKLDAVAKTGTDVIISAGGNDMITVNGFPTKEIAYLVFDEPGCLHHRMLFELFCCNYQMHLYRMTFFDSHLQHKQLMCLMYWSILPYLLYGMSECSPDEMFVYFIRGSDHDLLQPRFIINLFGGY